MKLLKRDVKRLGIYFFYDKDGIVDSYVEYFLDDLVKNIDRLVVVCNGKILNSDREKIKRYTEEIIVRPNEGLDVWAYKTALEYIGWKICEVYDEIVLCNSTSMGPVYPFSEMFLEMNTRDVDFWGITKVNDIKEFDFGCNPYGYLPEHVQSFFTVYRQGFVKSVELKEYWDQIPEIKTYYESVGLHESYFTKYFSDKGFIWDVYVNTDDLKKITENPLMYYPTKMISDYKCPVFKRRVFFHEYKDTLLHTTGETAIVLYKYLEENHLYDVNMIWDNILRCYNHTEIARQMHLNYTLSTTLNNGLMSLEGGSIRRIALIMHLYFDDLIESSFEWAEKMPSNTDIFITTDTESKKKYIEHVFKSIKCKSLDVRLIENRGRDVSALLVGIGPEVLKYDLVCFFHDKKSTNVSPGSVGDSFAYKCFSNLLYNKCYVKNVINLFEENPRLGLAVPPPPNHGIYHELYGRNWTINFENTKKLCESLDVRVPMNPHVDPIAPYGTEFWFRPRAMKKLFEKKWSYEDFPLEPMEMDGTIAHAVERCYQFVAQSEGYYSAIIMSDQFARIEYTNLDYYTVNSDYKRELEQKLKDLYGSTSWKVSKPVRIFGEFVKHIKGERRHWIKG